MEFRKKFWISKNREEIFISGVVIACVAASLITSYWHHYDMTEVKPKLKLNIDLSKKEQYKALKEADYMMPNLKQSTTFYKIETYAKPENIDK
jgi:hypothetical protein